jgi:hypothetical protein
MKKILLILILCLIPSLVFSQTYRAYSKPIIVDDGCTKDTSNLVMDYLDYNDSTMNLTANATGQSISYGSEWNLHSIVLEFDPACSSCVVSVRIGTSTNLGTYVEEWANVNISNDGEQKEFLSVLNSTYSASTTYYVGWLEVSGTCVLDRDTSSPAYAGGKGYESDSGWQLGGTLSYDASMSVYKCE